MSKQERLSWSLLITNLIVGFAYFSKVFAAGIDWRLQFAVSVKAFIQVTILAIALGIAGEIVMYLLNGRTQDRVAFDERDRLILLKSRRNGHFVLVTVLIALLVGLVVASGFRVAAAPQAATASAVFSHAGEALLMAHLLLLALVLTEIAVQLSSVFYYRRGY